MNWNSHILWHLCLTLYSLTSKPCECKQRFCKDILKDHGRGILEEKVLEVTTEECPLSASIFRIYRVLSTNETAVSELLLCWSPEVKRFVLNFDEPVTAREPVGLTTNIVHSCVRHNDTVVVQHKLISHLSVSNLLLKTTRADSFSLRALVITRKHLTYRRKLLQFTYSPEVSKITKRSVKDLKVTELSECGVTKSCFRYGSEGCGHFSCDYFLSYKVDSSTLLEIELSGRTGGWIAVGFSSDQSMGGDEVIACYKTGLLSNEINAGTYNNHYVHNRPKKHDGKEIVSLLQSEARDGFIYCKMTRPTGSEGFLDLTNDWFQFHAAGPVSQGGKLEKHTETPHVSRRMTVIRIENTYTWVQPKPSYHSEDKRTVNADDNSDANKSDAKSSARGSYLGHMDSHVTCLLLLTMYCLYDT